MGEAAEGLLRGFARRVGHCHVLRAIWVQYAFRFAATEAIGIGPTALGWLKVQERRATCLPETVALLVGLGRFDVAAIEVVDEMAA